MAAQKDFTVVIVGGGMCGLACATALLRAGVEAHVFESAPKFDEVGAGVGLGPNAVKALQGLGVLDDVLSRADPPKLSMRPYTFITGKGNHEHIFDYALSANEIGLSIYRPVFLDALVPKIDAKYTHFDKRAIQVSRTPSGRHVVTFHDNTSVEADLVIGADGIKSITREFVAGPHPHNHLAYVNTDTYRGMVSISALKKDGVKTDLTKPLIWAGMKKHVVTYPIRGNELLNIGAAVSSSFTWSPPRKDTWVERSVPAKEMFDAYEDWGHDIKTILSHIKDPSRWCMHAVDPPLEHYVKDKVVLVGDAAHAMVPHLGAGVGQGFEDSYVLYRLLTHPETNSTNLSGVLRIYDTIRPPRASMVARESARMGRLYHGFGPGEGGNTIKQTQEQVAGIWEPVWYHDLEKEVSQHLNRFFAHGGKL
ncbi:salicylate hydroxylase [Ephemerocybe angulata]|uniref:Salicylate hydroxylase n=1 Tax=Ephemerocybe angulata TaxID=980116 RepID=A0A8H6HYU0_9AGAR|nr:salicylate hydroxylase [Tulosesus angulatus]